MKKRTQNKFLNAIVSGIRTAFVRYSPKYGEVLAKARIEHPRYNQDGSLSKRPDVFYTCNSCRKEVKKIDVDHKLPVIEIGKSYKDYTLDQILARIDCDISNLQVLCEECHDKKSRAERALRKKE